MSLPAPFIFYLLPGFNLAALGAAAAVLTEEAPDRPFATAALGGMTVMASCGVRVRADDPIDDLPPDAVVIVLSGRSLPEDMREAAQASLRRAQAKGHSIWAIGAGVVTLAGAGLAEGARVVAHPDLTGLIRAAARRVEVLHGPFLWGVPLATARAAGAGPLMRHALAIEAREDAGEGPVRPSEAARSQLEPVSERYDTTHPTVLVGLEIMREHLFKPVPIATLAQQLGVSNRQLERHFERELGDSPMPIYREMRMEAARLEVREGRRPLREIAADFGMSAAGFSKVYAKALGIAPSDDRRASIAAGR